MLCFKSLIPCCLRCETSNKIDEWVHKPFVSMPDGFYNYPLGDFKIATSHNTYLNRAQICSTSSYNAIVECLNKGARMIELDIFADEDEEPIVSHGNEKECRVTSDILFEKCLALIAEYAWLDCDLPLFISYEINHHSLRFYEKLAKLTETTFGDILYKSPCTSNTLMRELINKVVVITSPPEIKSVMFNSVFKNIFYGDYWTKMPSTEVKTHNFDIDNRMIMIYPINWVFSTNYDPNPALMKGVQCVALNWQTNDKYLKQYLSHFPNNLTIIPKLTITITTPPTN